MSGYSMSRWMDLWLTNFCDSNPVSIIILFWLPPVCRSAAHSCRCLGYLSCRPLLLLLLLTFISLIFISVALFYVSWVCLGTDSHGEVSKSLENISLLWFSKEIPSHFTCGAPLHWHIYFVNPVSYKKNRMFMCLVRLLLDYLPLFSRGIVLLLSWYMIFSVTP